MSHTVAQPLRRGQFEIFRASTIYGFVRAVRAIHFTVAEGALGRALAVSTSQPVLCAF